MFTKRVMASRVADRESWRRYARRSVLLVGLGCALAGTLWAPAVSFGSVTPSCSVSNLRLDLVRTLGAAGARDWDFALRNVGSQTCQLKGYPKVALLDSRARGINMRVGRGRGTVREVVLRAWQRSFFTFHFESNAPCSSGIFPTGLQVVPPGNVRGLRIFRPFGECSRDRPAATPIRATLGSV